MKALALSIAAFAIIAPLAACGESESAREARAMREATPQRVRPDGSIVLSADDVRALGLMVASATEEDLPDSIIRFGQVAVPPANETEVASPVTGRLAAPAVRLGERVPAGHRLLQVVPVLDAAERVTLGTEAAQRQGEIEATERDLAKAEADLTRARALAPNVISAAQLQQAETTAATLRARLEALRQARAVQAQTQTAPVDVSAPLGGTVVSLTTSVGSLVQRGEALARILRPGSLWVDIAVAPDEPIGDRYEVLTATEALPAQLLSRGGFTAPDGTRHDRLEVKAPMASLLTPGASVSVRIGRGATRGVVVPESALVPGVETDTVFVETDLGVFVARAVRAAARFGGRVRLAAGLKPGERIAVQGAMGLQGELVRAQLQPEG